jgi:hypothetical protein
VRWQGRIEKRERERERERESIENRSHSLFRKVGRSLDSSNFYEANVQRLLPTYKATYCLLSAKCVVANFPCVLATPSAALV